MNKMLTIQNIVKKIFIIRFANIRILLLCYNIFS